MFSLRSILVIIAVALLVSLFSRLAKKTRSSVDKPEKNTQVDQMTKCNYCDVFIPEKDAVDFNGHSYCSKKHALKDNKDS